ncbi:hypothetical protein [Fibrella forsythiae]|uniref:Uncharacterized protein n=1 Tax=Fibrella forsythiae TaxID=2817061 RepID=A0ABS3JTC9_9BACT|nr:hypothetical protein [Fibrella forsythiae]MBO0953269.1 hypothetical protein [Fibrella forsythiae]
MPNLNFDGLASALATVGVTVVLIVLVKKFGNVPRGSTGPELNLLTYGALWDIINTAMKGEEYWKNMEYTTPALDPYKSYVLGGLTLLNFIFTAWNFKIAHRIETTSSLNTLPRIGLAALSNILGIFSLVLYLVFKTVWE